ncbi:MAG: hypothetical protein CL917_19385 [Deltaproteobacteria bacterium]|nr:hypothetical protein [Deltaproteobacteria bacterium]
MSPRYRKTLVLVVLVAALFGAGFYLREWLGIGLSPEDLSPSKIRENLLALGPAFPLACVALVAFRSFMGIPSGAALLLIGLVAGTSRGILYGSLGLIVSGSFIFTLARMAGREAVEARTPKRFRHVLELAGQRPGVLLVMFGTGYPLGLLTPLHAMAGISSMSILGFEFALGVGAVIRASTYIYFGSSLVEGEWLPILQASGVMILAVVLPLAFPPSRRWLREVFRPREEK